MSYIERLGVHEVPGKGSPQCRETTGGPRCSGTPPPLPASLRKSRGLTCLLQPSRLTSQRRRTIRSRYWPTTARSSALATSSPRLTDGTFTPDRRASAPALFIYRRSTPGSDVLVMVNLSGEHTTPSSPDRTRPWLRCRGASTWAIRTRRSSRRMTPATAYRANPRLSRQ